MDWSLFRIAETTPFSASAARSTMQGMVAEIRVTDKHASAGKLSIGKAGGRLIEG